MPKITTVSSVDEKSYQDEFYSRLYGDNDKWKEYVNVDRSTDGYTEGILFEHKTNVTSYGEAKALSQAIIYLTRFNRDGVPVPRYVCLVSQEEKKIFVYDMKNYLSYINDIEHYANMQASKGIPNFQNRIGRRMTTISYELGSYAGMKDIASFVEKPAETLKVNITPHNVYGWSVYYYDHAKDFHQKPEKKAFFNELRNPSGTLSSYIEPWTGDETDFRFIMDMLNDPMTQKRLGCFYTPPQYSKLSASLVRKPATNDRYETIATSLPRDEFPPALLRQMYFMRWGIETSFRELKYAIGLTSFHARKAKFIRHEILARIVMYNFCERIMAKTVIHVGKRKHTYQINYTMGFYVCRLYFRGINTAEPESEIARYILPVRPGRADRRKTIIKKGAVCFSYRVA